MKLVSQLGFDFCFCSHDLYRLLNPGKALKFERKNSMLAKLGQIMLRSASKALSGSLSVFFFFFGLKGLDAECTTPRLINVGRQLLFAVGIIVCTALDACSPETQGDHSQPQAMDDEVKCPISVHTELPQLIKWNNPSSLCTDFTILMQLKSSISVCTDLPQLGKWECAASI